MHSDETQRSPLASQLLGALLGSALAVGCAADPAPEPPLDMGEELPLAEGTRYVGWLGFTFDVPTGWSITAHESGATLRPPTRFEGEEIAVALRPVLGVTSSRDSDLPEILSGYATAEATDLAPLADTDSFASRAGADGVVVSFEPAAGGAEPGHARVYAIVDDEWTLLLRAVATPATLAERHEDLLAIARTLEIVPPRLDDALIGAWYSEETSEPGQNPEGDTFWDTAEKWLKLREDGSVRLRSYWKATVNGETQTGLAESNGRWAVYGDALFRLYNDASRGLHAFRLEGSGAKRQLILEPEGDVEEPTQNWREDPDVPF